MRSEAAEHQVLFGARGAIMTGLYGWFKATVVRLVDELRVNFQWKQNDTTDIGPPPTFPAPNILLKGAVQRVR